VAGLAVALPVAFVSADVGESPSAAASKKPKKCKKHQKRVKGKCKRKGKGQGSGQGQENGSPSPTSEAREPQLGSYGGDAIMKSFSVVKGEPGTQGRVYFSALAPSTESCPGPLYIGISEQTRDVEPVFIRNNQFSYSDSFDDGVETQSTVVEGSFTSPTTASGTVRFTMSFAAEGFNCDTGPLSFRVVKK
jgi:hypothetical protein